MKLNTVIGLLLIRALKNEDKCRGFECILLPEQLCITCVMQLILKCQSSYSYQCIVYILQSCLWGASRFCFGAHEVLFVFVTSLRYPEGTQYWLSHLCG